MGTYYLAHNETKRQKLDPEKVGGGSIKEGSVVNGDFANLCMFMALTGLWDSVSVIGDGCDKYNDVDDHYTDVTLAAVDEFNKSYSYKKIELSKYALEDTATSAQAAPPADPDQA